MLLKSKAIANIASSDKRMWLNNEPANPNRRGSEMLHKSVLDLISKDVPRMTI